jgi:hypothetical protein
MSNEVGSVDLRFIEISWVIREGIVLNIASQKIYLVVTNRPSVRVIGHNSSFPLYPCKI